MLYFTKRFRGIATAYPDSSAARNPVRPHREGVFCALNPDGWKLFYISLNKNLDSQKRAVLNRRKFSAMKNRGVIGLINRDHFHCCRRDGWMTTTYLAAGLLLCLMFLFSGCSRNKPEPLPAPEEPKEERSPFLVDSQEYVRIYFATTDQKYLLPVTLSVKSSDEVGKIAVQKLLAGPENDFSSPTIPEGTKLKDLYLSGSTAYLDLTVELNQVRPENAQMAVDALILTVTEFAVADDVQILIDGKIQADLAGVAINSPLPRPKINFAGGEGQSLIQVYFGDQNAMYLVPLTYATDNPDLPLAAMAQLLLGPPEGSGLYRTIWPETQVLGITLADGLATVDLSRQALGYGGGSAAESFFVNSLVWTLTGLETVESVQLLIQGEKLQYLPEGTDISAPIPGTDLINWIQE